VGTAIAQALAMPLDERRARHDAMFQVLLTNDAKSWGERFLIALALPLAFPNWSGQSTPGPGLIRGDESERLTSGTAAQKSAVTRS
jgi:trehalose 6-phosphate synthase